MKKILLPSFALFLSAVFVSAQYAYDFSVLHIEPDVDRGASDDLDGETGFSFQWRTDLDNTINFGLEYIQGGGDYGVGRNITAGEATALNNAFGTTFVAGNSSIREDLETHNLLLNAIYQYEISDDFDLVFSGGLGVSYMKYDLTISNPGQNIGLGDEDWVFVYQLRAGAAYRFADNWSVNAGVRFIDFAEGTFAEAGLSADVDADAVVYDLGVSYHF